MKTVSRRLIVEGVVQGVGFRPHVYRIARRCTLAGSVQNHGAAVIIEVCGPEAMILRFIDLLKSDAPSLARIDTITIDTSKPVSVHTEGFTIAESASGRSSGLQLPPDTFVCEECHRELMDPASRRYHHPFIACTVCGPRYTVAYGLPYDRSNTTLGRFPLCDRCRQEYSSVDNRRFHAELICCPECGPQLKILDATGTAIQTTDPLGVAIEALRREQIVAVKGVGGFHLACRADSEPAVAALRNRKRRPSKPFAVMVRSLEQARRYVCVSPREADMLCGQERPIVLLRRLPMLQTPLAEQVAPGLSTVGIMLPSSPLHLVLLERMGESPLVMTSGNSVGDLLCADNEEAVRELSHIADCLVVHDRDIHHRIDDSVVRLVGVHPIILRSGRGYVPRTLAAPFDISGTLAYGGIEKSSVAVGVGRMALVSQYLGNASAHRTLEHVNQVVGDTLASTGCRVSVVAYDSHPANPLRPLVTAWNLPCMPIQHHHAHAAACLGENGVHGPAICVVFDGAGYGDDGTIWGGEFLVADFRGFTRLAHLDPVPMPGNDAATRFPGRMALSWIGDRLGERARDLFSWMPQQEYEATRSLAGLREFSPLTSSMGRLFDSVSAILGICRLRTYEGQPAIELEAVADPSERTEYAVDVRTETLPWRIDGAGLLLAVIDDMVRNAALSIIAARVHATIAALTVKVAVMAADHTGIDTVALSGGCFTNARLLADTVSLLRAQKLKPLVQSVLPPNDESLAWGQVLIASARRPESP